ncbi:hypothetical protein EUX98_g5190 [Antrodiella citrinella]|uniref:Uncharacterized protein n=1 Tax=Antrodiella citrinella TaxID=2447956 RepID=A0A4S4MUX3_9APHY|nr:hypothetical protein EUX98_g5190 [Antrodiella citrinella]
MATQAAPAPSVLADEIRRMCNNMRAFFRPFNKNEQVTLAEKKKALQIYITNIERLEGFAIIVCASLEAMGHASSQSWFRIRAQLQTMKDRFAIHRNVVNEQNFIAISEAVTPVLDGLTRALDTM